MVGSHGFAPCLRPSQSLVRLPHSEPISKKWCPQQDLHPHYAAFEAPCHIYLGDEGRTVVEEGGGDAPRRSRAPEGSSLVRSFYGAFLSGVQARSRTEIIASF